MRPALADVATCWHNVNHCLYITVIHKHTISKIDNAVLFGSFIFEVDAI